MSATAAAHDARDQRTAADRAADDAGGPDAGLSAREAAARRERYGPNALEERRHSTLLELASHFWGPIPWMIEAAVVLTAVTARWADFGIILALLLLNGAVGFWEEHQAAGAIAALKERLATQARVLRDGAWTTVPAEQVVPGDLVAVGRGDVVPADGHVAAGTAETDESTLTGESLPVEKRTGDPLFSGTAIVRGNPRLRVLATGARTQLGRTAELTGAEGPQSHFQQAILSIGTYLIAIAVALVAVIVAVSLLRGESVAETLELALVVTIASIPVALPAVLSVTLAVGARYLAKREAVVSHLPAVEEMAGVDVLCSDKTGTITKNELAVADVAVLAAGATREDVLRAAALTAEPGGDDPLDRAVLAALGDGRLDDFEVVDFEPFDAARKRAQARVRDSAGREQRVAKGANQAILELAGVGADGAERVAAATLAFAEKGYRALAVAGAGAAGGDGAPQDDGEGAWHVLGVLALADPPREDSRATLAAAAALGVDVKMVTGDRVEIARQIARELEMGDAILEASAIERLDGDALAARVERADGFAQVVPEDKYRIVAALQARGHIVGMTGDGVNDAPALSRADAGIAVSGATDAARAAADIVLLSAGLSVIVEAIHRAREVFRRMANYAIYRITETIRVVLFVTIAIVIYGFFPVTPTQIVLLAILNDAAILTIAYDRVLPSARPERWQLTEVLTIATVLGLAGVVESLSLLAIAIGPLGVGHAEAQTLMYLKLSVAGHLTLFVARTRGPLWSHRPATVLLVAVVGTQALATAIAVSGLLMEPLRWPLAALAWGYAIVWILLLDRLKLVAYRALERRGTSAPPAAPAPAPQA